MQRAKCQRLLLNISFLFLLSFLSIHDLYSSKSDFSNDSRTSPNSVTRFCNLDVEIGCKDLHKYHKNQAKCSYIKSHNGCHPRGYISYLQLFYCTFTPPLSYVILILWLIVLFYLLGDTSATYFCSSLEGLSKILKLSPAVAGVTLLSLGNGAPDLFASIISFSGDDSKNLGLNGILGSAFFVSSVIVGIICISSSNHNRSINKSSFFRDVIFLTLSVSIVLVITLIGKINLWGAICFLSVYFLYVLLVCTSSNKRVDQAITESPVLPISNTTFEEENRDEVSDNIEAPLLGYRIDEPSICFFGQIIVCIVELPLQLPRRLTIPVVSSERWSKPFGVLSFTIAPVFLSVIWNPHGSKLSLAIYEICGLVGIISGVVVFFTTKKSSPPGKCLFPWFVAAFVMSITWTYILARELISLLVSLGLVLGINPSILGLTVLAWGNSLGDLVVNVTMARHGGPDGTQVAISGCYGGAIFNVLVGLGCPFVFSAWNVYPSSYNIPDDSFLYETGGFLMGGLVWAIIIITKKYMRLNRLLGGGLLIIYVCFLSLEMARTLGLVEFGAYGG